MRLTKFITGIQRSRLARSLRKYRIPELRWQHTLEQVDVLQRLSRAEQHHLRELASAFLRNKTISGAGGFVVNEEIRALIAGQACLLILGLDLTYFEGWHEVIVYPDSFIVSRDETDALGLVHASRRLLGGESWGRGPVVLSWSDAQPGTRLHTSGSNVILHEFAHKLDMLNGAANGMPPLHPEMHRQTWTQVFQHAYDDLSLSLQRHHQSGIDPYAAENPAEFFAVITELFFEKPDHLLHVYPAVYEQLRQFYRQDPLCRL